MNPMREKQKAEAVFRLKLMGIREDVRQKFEEDEVVMLCENGVYSPLPPTMVTEIHQFERERDATVFLVVRMYHIFGTLDAMLYVGKYEEEWEIDQDNIKGGYAMSYCINRDNPDCSEFGSIAFRVTDGIIIREG